MAVRKGTFRNVVNSKAPQAKQLSARRGFDLENIKDRPHGDTRSLNKAHVQELAESIEAVGLIQPLAVDSEGYLLAGGHRRAALQQLKQEQPERFEALFPTGVPARVFDFSAKTESEQAIAIEAAENEKRLDYTPAEVRELADKLVEAGYRDIEGRPKKGQKALTPALMTILGKSRRTVQRYLKSDTDKTAPSDAVSQKQKKIARAIKALESLGHVELDSKITRAASKLVKMLEAEQ